MHFAEIWRRLTRKYAGQPGKKAFFPTCWVCERKHRVPKRWINHHLNTSSRFDRSAFRDVVAFSLAQLEEHAPLVEVGLRGSVKAIMQGNPLHPLLMEVFGDRIFQTARMAHASIFETVHVGDVVVGSHAGQRFLGRIAAHIEVDKVCFSILSAGTCTRSDDDASTWDFTGSSLILVRTRDIMSACVFMMQGASMVVLTNPRCR